MQVLYQNMHIQNLIVDMAAVEYKDVGDKLTKHAYDAKLNSTPRAKGAMHKSNLVAADHHLGMTMAKQLEEGYEFQLKVTTSATGQCKCHTPPCHRGAVPPLSVAPLSGDGTGAMCHTLPAILSARGRQWCLPRLLSSHHSHAAHAFSPTAASGPNRAVPPAGHTQARKPTSRGSSS